MLLLPLTALALSAIGMALGSLLNSLEMIQIIVNLLLFVLIMAAPVFIPWEALPVPFKLLGYLLPPSYAADALRRVLSGTIDVGFYVDLAILSFMTLMSFIILNRWLNWRV